VVALLLVPLAVRVVRDGAVPSEFSSQLGASPDDDAIAASDALNEKERQCAAM
jgi:hypothetical protein